MVVYARVCIEKEVIKESKDRRGWCVGWQQLKRPKGASKRVVARLPFSVIPSLIT
jgi:hypothetical protein